MFAHVSRLVVHNVGVTDAEDPGHAGEPTFGKRARRDAPPDQPLDRPAADGPVDDQPVGDDFDDPEDDETDVEEHSPGRRITFWVGIGLILAGLGLLGYVAWQFFGTNIVSQRHQRQITSELQQNWTAGTGKKPKFVPKGQASALIRIPRFGKKYVVPVLEGVSEDILAKGYGHFQTGGVGGAKVAYPGDVGNYALAAHRVTHGEPLRHMPDLRPGDKVIVETVDTTYTYVLDTNPNALVIPFTGVWVLDPVPHNPDAGGPQPAQVPGQRLITLTTCSEIFHTDNRMIAFGHLAGQRKKTVAQPVD